MKQFWRRLLMIISGQIKCLVLCLTLWYFRFNDSLLQCFIASRLMVMLVMKHKVFCALQCFSASMLQNKRLFNFNPLLCFTASMLQRCNELLIHWSCEVLVHRQAVSMPLNFTEAVYLWGTASLFQCYTNFKMCWSTEAKPQRYADKLERWSIEAQHQLAAI